jgi:hypothetical protein
MRRVSQENRSSDLAGEVAPEIVVDAAPLPARRPSGTIEIWGRDVPVAVAATAGAAAGIAAVAVARSGRSARRVPRRGLFRRREKVVARRSFLVDVHVLGR